MHPRFLSTVLSFLVVAAAPAARSSEPLVLQPQPGAMQVKARVPALGNQAFALGIPETIGCREAMLVNFPEAKIDWQGPDQHGVVLVLVGAGRMDRLHVAAGPRRRLHRRGNDDSQPHANAFFDIHEPSLPSWVKNP